VSRSPTAGCYILNGAGEPGARLYRTGDVGGRSRRCGARCSGSDAWGGGTHFFELGVHSLLAVQVVSGLRQALDVELSAVFEHPVFATLVDDVLDLQLARFDPETLARLSELVHEPVPGDEAPG
jgi:Phosphopantetheine attachment site